MDTYNCLVVSLDWYKRLCLILGTAPLGSARFLRVRRKELEREDFGFVKHSLKRSVVQQDLCYQVSYTHLMPITSLIRR